MTILAAADTHALWLIVLGMGAVVLVVVIILMMLLLSLVEDIEGRVDALLEVAGVVASHTVNIPKLTATPPVLKPRHRGGHHPGRLHERPHRRLHRGG